MTSRPNVPAICPPASSIIRSAASHPSGPLGRVPRPHRYYQPTPTSRPPSRITSFPSLSATTASPSFAPPGPDDSPGAWTISTAAPVPPLNGGEDEISQVPGRPLRTCPALRPRRTSGPRPVSGPAVWSSVQLTTSTPRFALSRLYHAACTLSVYASQPGSPPDRATLDSGWWPALTGQDSHLLGRVEGFRHVCPFTWLLPSPSFAWRNNCSPGLGNRIKDSSIASPSARTRKARNGGACATLTP